MDRVGVFGSGDLCGFGIYGWPGPAGGFGLEVARLPASARVGILAFLGRRVWRRVARRRLRKSIVWAPRLGRSATFVDDGARQSGLDASLVRAVVRRESGYNPCATSRKGAQGLMQLMP